MRRDWTTFANYAYSVAAQRDVLYVIKSILTNTNSVSNTLASGRVWSVVSSSNASTTSSSDLWTATTALTRAAAGTAHSWIVLYNATAARYLTLDYVGSTAYGCDVILSTDAPSGGTTLNRPTVTNGVSFTWNFDRPTLTAETRYFSMTADQYGGFHILHHRGNGEQVIVAMLCAIRGLSNWPNPNGGVTSFGAQNWLAPQRGAIDGGYYAAPGWLFMQCGGNQTGNAHLLTPTGTNTAANLFAASGGKVRMLLSSENTNAAPYYAAAVLPPRAVTTAGTEASFFGTVNSSTYGKGPYFSWPLMVTEYYSTTPTFYDSLIAPDFYVTPESTAYTSPTASTGGPYMGYSSDQANNYTHIFCNGLAMPWGDPNTLIQGTSNAALVCNTGGAAPFLGTNFGGSKDNRISARNGRGVGGW